MSTQTMGSTSLLLDRDLDPSTGEPRESHIIAPKDGVEGHVLAFQARIEGTPVTALCGHVLVPMRDPKEYPLCPRCKEIFTANTGAEDGFQEG